MSATSSGQQHRAPKFVYLFHDTENLHFGGATASATDIYNRTLKTAIAAITDQATADAINLTQLVVNWEFPMAQSAAQQDIATFGHSSRKQWWPSPKHIAEFRTLGVHITDMDVKKGSMDLYLRNVISDRLFELREHEVADKSKYLFVVLSGDRDFSGVVRDIVRDGYRCVCIYGATAPFAPINPALEAQADAALGVWQSICGYDAQAAQPTPTQRSGTSPVVFPFSVVKLQLEVKLKLSPVQKSTLKRYMESTVLKMPVYKLIQDQQSYEITVLLNTKLTKSVALRQKGIEAALVQSPINLRHINGLSAAEITVVHATTPDPRDLDGASSTVADDKASPTDFHDSSFGIERSAGFDAMRGSIGNESELVVKLTFDSVASFPEIWLLKLKRAMAAISKLTVESLSKSTEQRNSVTVHLSGTIQNVSSRRAWFESHPDLKIRSVAANGAILTAIGQVLRAPRVGKASSSSPLRSPSSWPSRKQLNGLRCSLPNFAVAHQLNLDSNLFNALRDKLEQTDSSLEVKLDGSAVRIEGCSMGQRDQLFAIVNKFAEDHLDITKLVLEKHYLAPRETRERLQQLPQLKTLPHHNVSFHVEMAGFDDLKFLLIGAPADWDLGQAKSAIETEMDIPIFRIKEHAAGELLISVRLGPGYSKDVMLKKVRKVAMKGARTIDSHHVQVKRYLKKDTTVFMVCNKGDADGSVRVEKATQAINSLGALGITVGIPAEVVTMTTESAAYLKKHLEDQAEVTVSVKDENCVVELFGTQSANDVAKKLLQGFWARLVTSDYTIVASGEHKKYMEKWCSKHLQAYLNTQLSGIDDQQGSATKDDDDDSTNQDAGTYKKHRPRGSDQPTYALQITANSSKGFDIKLTTFKSDTTIQALLERLVSRVQCFEEQSLEIPPAIHTKYSEPGKPGKLLGYLLHGFRTHAFLDNRRQGLPLLKIWAPKEELDMAVQVAKGRLKGGKQSTQTISCSCIENAALLRMPYFENDRQTLAKMLASLQVALQLAASEGAQLFTIEGEDQAVQSAADITRDWLKNKERLVVSKTYPLKHASHARFLLSTANDLVDKAKTQGVLIAEHTTSQPATKLIQAKVQQLTVEVLHCSLDQVHAAAVVNASNPTLSHAGGIATAFVKLADGDLQAQSNASVQSYGPVNGGTCRVVGRLKRGADIIHATAPRYRSHVDEITYKATINAVLSTSASKGYTSIAMPLLGAGIFDWDDARAAELVVSCLQSFAAANPTCMMRVVLFDQDRDAADALVDAIQAESDSANRGSGSGTEVSGSGTEVSQPFCLGFSDCSLPVQRLRPQVPPKLLLAHPIDLPMSGFGKRIFIEPRTDRCGFPMTMTSSFRLSVLVSKARQR
eukprot:m.272940 g.272940  ORF g.272940 m.272940 type:complete len:1359 (-) comp17681_c0_seq5:1276-5352(-)